MNIGMTVYLKYGEHIPVLLIAQRVQFRRVSFLRWKCVRQWAWKEGHGNINWTDESELEVVE